MKKQIFLIVLLLLKIIKGYSQDIKSDAAVVLPASGQTSYSVPSGHTVNISSGQSVTLGNGVNLQSGSVVKISIYNALLQPPPSNPANDYDKNWVYVRSYDENGNEIGASKSFFDNNGRLLQTQTKSESTGHVLASQTLHDLQGRAAASTLVAPTYNASFAYKNNFVTNAAGTPYDYTNFDWNNVFNSTTPYTKTNSPDPVNNATEGSLGWYYSNNNALEPMVGPTAYPYSRTDFFHDGSGAAKRSAGIGESLRMGLGRETSGGTFPVQNELNTYLAIRNQVFPSTVVGSAPASMAGQALQSISTDQNGLSVLSVTDLTGKLSLMSGRADAAGWLTVQNTLSLRNVLPTYSYIFNELSALGFPATTLSIAAADGVTINVICRSCSPQTAIYSGSANNYTFTGDPGSVYLVSSDATFNATETTANINHTIVVNNVAAQTADPTVTSSQYFQLVIPSAVTATGDFKLYNMTSEADITTEFTSGNTLQPGYYKIVANPATSTNVTNNVTVTYTNKYSDVTFNYYNQLGQLVANIAPNGVQQLLTNGYSGYTAPGQLPFVTTYEYDLQGRLIASTSPDGGRAEYVYRTDGKIRFSQNAHQKAITGIASQFSYTNYDNFGRPVESGEYVVPIGGTLTFESTKTSTTLPDNVSAGGGLTGGTKLSTISTAYDVPVTNPSALVQDAGFLKGAVSYTNNANSSTWYNYDDHGRVTWMVKQIAGLSGYETVNYTYNDQGNVTVVDYKRGTTDKFSHYYSYDADGRLINVKTSSDGGTTKLQQANYYYYLHGPLKRVELGDKLQGMDYTYTPQGWLKAINSPTGVSANDPGLDGVGSSTFAKDAFGMQLEYFNGDYSRIGSHVTSIPTGSQTYYNGNVTGMSWQSNKPALVVSGSGDPTIQNPTMYTYSYDPKYQYNQSVWGTPNYTSGTFASSTIFGEKGITYDYNGNITALQRTDKAGTLTDNFTKYTYQANTNQLTGVGTTAAPTAYASYAYDELGRLKNEVQNGTGGSTYYLQYDVTGKITGVYSDAGMTNLKTSYTYDESGNRIMTVNATTTTYYVYDASGNVLAIYTGTTTAPTPALAEVPVYGSSRLGTYFASGSNYVYEIRDNVGNVRVALNRTKVGGQADVYTYNDYFPYGSIARSGGTTYRYDYQGAYAEKDPVTGLNNFDLRMYDGRIGRWLSVDPAGQFASPYEGMGNNPVSGSDPTGGYDTRLGAWFASLFGIKGSVSQNQDPASLNYQQYYYAKSGTPPNNGTDGAVAYAQHYGNGSSAYQVHQELGREAHQLQAEAEYDKIPGNKISMMNPYTGKINGSGAITDIYPVETVIFTVATYGGSVEVEAANEGIYEFTATSGKTYVGQSGDIATRLEQHIASGKLAPGTVVKTTEALGGKTAREIAEQVRINSLGGIYQNGVKVLENVRNPIGISRQYLLPK